MRDAKRQRRGTRNSSRLARPCALAPSRMTPTEGPPPTPPVVAPPFGAFLRKPTSSTPPPPLSPRPLPLSPPLSPPASSGASDNLPHVLVTTQLTSHQTATPASHRLKPQVVKIRPALEKPPRRNPLTSHDLQHIYRPAGGRAFTKTGQKQGGGESCPSSSVELPSCRRSCAVDIIACVHYFVKQVTQEFRVVCSFNLRARRPTMAGLCPAQKKK